MKKYFTKYLPGEEKEVKEGDKVLYTGKELEFPEGVYTVLDNVKEKTSVPSVGGYGIYYQRSVEELPDGKKKIIGAYLKIGYNIFFGEHLTKVKLFLCTNHIEVGDDYYNDSFEFTKYPNKSVAGSSAKWVGNNDSYKVIGEISPNAKWITEGMEFDKDQLYWLFRTRLNTKWRGIRDDFDPEKYLREYSSSDNCMIKIKCPCCGTFK